MPGNLSKPPIPSRPKEETSGVSLITKRSLLQGFSFIREIERTKKEAEEILQGLLQTKEDIFKKPSRDLEEKQQRIQEIIQERFGIKQPGEKSETVPELEKKEGIQEQEFQEKKVERIPVIKTEKVIIEHLGSKEEEKKVETQPEKVFF